MEEIRSCIRSFLEEKKIYEDFELKVSPKSEWGDLTTNLPLRIYGKYKVDISEELKKRLEEVDIVKRVDVVRGNLNIFLDWKKFSRKFIKDICEKGIEYFRKDLGKNKTVVIDYFSVNIARLPHFGHLRSGVMGSVLRNLFEFFGYRVIGVNFWGDVGTQFGALIYSFKKWGSFDELRRKGIKHLMELYVKFHEEKEKNPEIWERAKEEYKKVEEGDPENRRLLELFKKMTRKRLKETWYKWFNLRFEDERGESSFIDETKEVANELLDKKIAFFGENGEIRVDLEKYGLGKPVFIKSDGTTLYFSRDFTATLKHFEEYKFSKKIFVVSNEQSLHFKQLIKLFEVSGYNFYKDLYHLKFGMLLIKTEKGAKKMSTRKGRVISAEEAIRRTKIKVKRIMWKSKKVGREEIDREAWKVALGSIIFFILKYEPKKDIVFDWDRILDFDGFSGPFVQYSAVRARSILENIERGYEIHSLEPDKYERNLMREILRTGEILTESLRNYKLNLLAEHSYRLARAFNEFYESCPVIREKDEKRKAFRYNLTKAFFKIMKDILSLMNIEIPSRM